MRNVFLILLLLAAPGLLLGQEAPPAQAPAQAKPAPKLGHPLDPADVAILTGKAKASSEWRHRFYATPYVYLSYRVNAPLFAPVSTATRPPFAPVVFGRFGERPFVVIRRTAPLRPDLLFSLGGSRRTKTLVLAPVSPRFRLWPR